MQNAKPPCNKIITYKDDNFLENPVGITRNINPEAVVLSCSARKLF